MTSSSTPQAAKKRHWAQINETGFLAGMRLLFWIGRALGRWPFRVVLYPIMGWYVLTKPAARAASINYLRRMKAFDASVHVAPNVWNVMHHFAAFGECLLDKMLLWGGVPPVGETVFFGEQQLNEDIAAQRGGLLISSHLGNVELCRVLARQHGGLKLTILAHTDHAQKFNELLAQLDPGSQLDLLPVNDMSPATAMLLNERVARGEFVVIAGDRIPIASSVRTCTASFLGAPARFPIGAHVLAGLLQCPVYLLFSMRIGNRSEIHFERFRNAVQLPRAGRDAALAALAQEYATRLEHFCRRAPLQWFNFYDFWHLPDMDMNDASR